ELEGFLGQIFTAAGDADFGDDAILEYHHRVFDGTGFVRTFALAIEVQDNFLDRRALAAEFDQFAGCGVDVLAASEDVKVGAADGGTTAIATRRCHWHGDTKTKIGDLDCILAFRYVRGGFTFNIRVPAEHQICIKRHKLS